MSNRIYLNLLGATALGTLFSAGPALAQAVQPAEGSNAQSSEVSESTGLADIIVTAQRVSQNLQKAAIPVSVISAEQLSRAGVSTPDALTATTTSLTVAPSGGARMSFFLRGVGNFTNNPLFDSAIAFNYDNVYIGRPAGTAGVLYDLERVEVLKGPQGTLYGRNATGGAINVLPRKPELGEFSGFLTGTYGNYDAYTLEGAVNLPMGPNGALRVSGNIARHDGYLSDGSQDEDTQALRVQMAAELTPTLSVRFSGDYAHVGGVGSGYGYLAKGVFNPVTQTYAQVPTGLDRNLGIYAPASQAYKQTILAFPGGRTLGPLVQGVYNNNDYFGFNAEIKLDMDAGDLTFIPAYRFTKQDNIVGPGGFPAGTREKDNQYSFELRFAGKRIGIFDYQVGALYYDESNKGSLFAAQQNITASQDYNQSVKSLAGFARATMNLSDRFRVVGGARYTRDKKRGILSSDQLVLACLVTTPPFCPTAPLIPTAWKVRDLPSIGYPVPPLGGAAPALGPNGIPSGALLVRLPITADRTLKTNKLTWRGAVEFDVTPTSLVYASVETGFRAGGVQPVNGFETYAPEKITAYTLGSKNRFLDNRLQLNIEAFYWKYRDQQLAAIQGDANGQQGFITKNIGQTTMYGVDVGIIARATDTTTLNVQAEYLHTEYDRFLYTSPVTTPFGSAPPPFTTCDVSIVSGQYAVDCSGKPAYNAPKWTVNLGIEQIVPLGDYNVTINANTQFRSGRWTGFNFQPAQYQGSTWQSNAQVGFGPSSNQWTIAAYVRNIENDRFVQTTNYSDIGSLTTAIYNSPRTYGIRASVNF